MDKNDFKINLSLNETNLNKSNNNLKKEKNPDNNIVNNIIENINENNIDTIFGMSILAHIAIDYLNNN